MISDDDKYKTSKLVNEFNKYTPLMLAITVGDSNLKCVAALLQHKANHLCEDDQGNNIVHIAAIHQCNTILTLILKFFDMDLSK